MKKFSSLLTGEQTTINDRMSGDRRGGLAMFHCSNAREATPLPHASPYERWRHITIYGREPNPQRVRHFASGGPFRSIARWVPANSSSSVPSLTPSSFRISAELLVAISHSFALPPHCSLSRTPLVSTHAHAHAPRRLARTSLPSRKRDCQENIVSSVWSCVLPGCDTYVLRLPVGHDVPLQFEESYVRMVAR